MYELDEILFDDDEITDTESDRRKRLINEGLPDVSASSLEDSLAIEQAVEARLVFDAPVSLINQAVLSADALLCASDGRVKMYDGALDALAATPDVGDMLESEQDETLLLVRARNVDFSGKQITLGREVIEVRIKRENDEKFVVNFSVNKIKPSLILQRIKEAFPNSIDVSVTDSGNGAVQYYEMLPDNPIKLNSAVFSYLVMNDPVMSLLYEITKYKDTKTKIELRRRNANQDNVSLYQLSDGYIGIYYTSATGNDNVIRKIIASIQYYSQKESGVREVYSMFSQPSKNILLGFDLEQAAGYIDKSENVKIVRLTQQDKKLRQNVDAEATMQNNFGVSASTLRFMAQNAALAPDRWVNALSRSIQANVYLFSEEGMIVPRSRDGLYPGTMYENSIFVFVKNTDGCMLIVKRRNYSSLKVTKKYNTINAKYSGKVKDAPNKTVPELFACIPPTLETILGENYLFLAVDGGDSPSGILACVTSAKNTGKYTGRLDSNSDDVKRVEDMKSDLSHFFVGAADGTTKVAQYLQGPQIVDENGKYCGSPTLATDPAAPLPSVPVVSAEKQGVVHEFLNKKRAAFFLNQVCLYRFSKRGGKSVHDFARDELEETGTYPSLDQFSETLDDNFKGQKIPVPKISPVEFMLRQAMKDDAGLRDYKSRIFLEGFYSGGASRKGSIIEMPVSLYFSWKDDWTRADDTYHMSPSTKAGDNEYWLNIKQKLGRAQNYNTFSDARAALQLKDFRNPVLFTHDKQNEYKLVSGNSRETTAAIVGWKTDDNNQIFTIIVFL
tara:strand:+ start:9368 stop:11722 length:2355 start_codon:yes stop_codon:yes gene_type:complete